MRSPHRPQACRATPAATWRVGLVPLSSTSPRREFSITERFHLQLRAEGFNVLNHPIFGAIYNQLSVGSARFGLAYNTMNTQLGGLNSLYQMGGPRSLQLALKLRF